MSLAAYTIEFIKWRDLEEYELYHIYSRIDECVEIIRGQMLLSTKDAPAPIKVEGINGILFLGKDGILAEYKVIEVGAQFHLYTLSMAAWNLYEAGAREVA